MSAVYISKEYLEEAASISQSNVYFGYTIAELDEIFQGTRYIFTLGDDGTTAVQELQVVDDHTAETMLRNIAIGTGVILVCVTVSVVSAGAGAPAVQHYLCRIRNNGQDNGGFICGIRRYFSRRCQRH